MTLMVYSLVVGLSLSHLGCMIYHSTTNLMLYSGKTKKKVLKIVIHKHGILRAGHNYCNSIMNEWTEI